MSEGLQVGRYMLHRKIARGGMASIHIARLMGDVGFSRIVAAKRMHPELAEDDEFVAMFLDEARIASKVHHRNVVPVLDVVTLGEEVMLVQEYIHGAPLSLLLQNATNTNSHVPVPVAVAIASQVLAGLHAAHETTDELGDRLEIIHRDVSPQNIIVGTDGSARLLDFGVAKASASAHVTRKGTFKGKLGYSAPEQIRGEATRQSDVYSLGVVLWEMLVGKRLHANVHGEPQLIAQIMNGKNPTLTEALDADRSWIGAYRWSQLEALEPIVRKSIDVAARRRWQTAADMEEALAGPVPVATSADVAAWLRAVGREFLDEREKMIAEEEASWRRAAVGTPHVVAVPEDLLIADSEPSILPRTRSAFIRRSSAVMLLGFVALLGVMLAFLFRDRERNIAAPPTTAIAPPIDTPTVRTVVEAPVDAPPAPPPPLPAPVVVKRPAPVRFRAVRSPPMHAAVAKSTPPKPAAAPALDCTTPFYFEGKKKVFKPGCL